MAGRGPMHDVELVEDDEPMSAADVRPDPPADDAPPTDAPPAAAPSDPRARRRLALAAAVLAVVVGGAVVAQGVVDRRERARVATVAELPGAVAPLAGPASLLWAASDEMLSGLDVRTPDGLLVGVSDSAEGPVHVRALDARTGEVAWQVELIDGSGRPDTDSRDDLYRDSGSCAAGLPDDHLAVCLAHDGSASFADGSWEGGAAPSTMRLVVLDTRDGSVVTDLSDALAPGTSPWLATVDDVVVLYDGLTGSDTQVRGVRFDGTLAWQRPLPAADGAASSLVVPVGDLVAVATPTDVLLLDAEGTTVRAVPLGDRTVMGAWRDAFYLTNRQEFDSDGNELGPPLRTTVVRADGEVEVDGDPVGLGLDDGSVPGLVLTAVGNGTRAWDREGRALWSLDTVTAWGAVLLDGRLHLTLGTDQVALDARTGAELWRSGVSSHQPVTDGRHLLTLVSDPAGDAGSELVALDPSDGSEVWRSPLPGPTDALTSVLHLLVAYRYDPDADETSLTVLG
ncbi:PQQ-binding-like beta-propeller repeat protein [Cellulomonas sp. S1-8]|uniref:outer membrane protein assembly factor BamB family protein n=1 Tax=Cellulomonas sp. S1-8 TaxID=2904790 RepID=UPI002244EA6A|nr:PQQ-binding-like beta-propeller repeat protein [Cellulomonas sp. S1-8]UZN03433.1 PQQ-binding-like beta-propeller repeat protein [Cellulomonas sp. S1-8]